MLQSYNHSIIQYGRFYINKLLGGSGKKSVIVFSKPIDEKTNKPMENIKLVIVNYISQVNEDTSSYVITDKVTPKIKNYNNTEVNFSLTSDKLDGKYYITGNALFYQDNEIVAVTPFYCDSIAFGKSETYDVSVRLTDNNNYYYKPVEGIDHVEISIACISPY